MTSAILSNLLKVQLLRCLLVGKPQREKHSHIIREIQSKMNCVMKNPHNGGEAVRVLIEKLDDTKARTKKIVVVALTQFEEVMLLENSFKKIRITGESLKDKGSLLKDGVVSIST